MRRTTLSIDGRAYELATGTDSDGLKKAIEEAVSAGGKFVDVTVLGDTVISVLASPGVPILLTSREINIDDVDDDTSDQADVLDIVEWEIAGEF
jgi:hypothetical protein